MTGAGEDGIVLDGMAGLCVGLCVFVALFALWSDSFL
jgi:hypothetical protein